MQGRSKKVYDNFGNTLKQHLENCFPNIKLKKVGSRAKGTNRKESDLDYQICFEGGKTTKEEIYPKIVKCLETKVKDKDKPIHHEFLDAVREGGSGNVVNVTFRNGGKISFALMPCEKF